VKHGAARKSIGKSISLLAVCLCAANLTACRLKPDDPFKDRPGTGGPVENPFVPASMTIHALTRIDTDPAGKLWIYCHIEFKDAWGDNVKAAGQLQVQLYRPAGPRAAGPGRQEVVWTVDLLDLKKNASFYDPATRTYRLPLENPPEWLRGPAPEADLPKARLKAIFTTSGPRGEIRTLEDEFALA
jgi:hypothetical protein